MTRARQSVWFVVMVCGWTVGCRTGNAGGDSAAGQPSAPASSGYVEELFAGRFPGVRVFRMANGALSFEIRGRSTIYGSTQPLLVIDGVPVEAEDGMLFLNPADIQRIEVLKDVGSTAQYGVRGANGVVLITTAVFERRRNPAPHH
jgi:TonB-dependent SusC/RagA subfamily outer membrane receptor